MASRMGRLSPTWICRFMVCVDTGRIAYGRSDPSYRDRGLDCRPLIPVERTVRDGNRNQVRADTVTHFKSVSCLWISLRKHWPNSRHRPGVHNGQPGRTAGRTRTRFCRWAEEPSGSWDDVDAVYDERALFGRPGNTMVRTPVAARERTHPRAARAGAVRAQRQCTPICIKQLFCVFHCTIALGSV